MRKSLFFLTVLAALAWGSLSAFELIYNQPYNLNGCNGSMYSTLHPFDNEIADNFSGLTQPITQLTFYGITGLYDYAGEFYYPVAPAANEPFRVKFYDYTTHWTAPDPGLTIPGTGDYKVRLHDTYGDGWDVASLDVLVNGVTVLNNITLPNGTGPLDFPFNANAGDHVVTVYTAGSWPGENWYEILDHGNNVLATDGPPPQSIGDIPPLIAPSTGTYTVTLSDSYGDGWNGGALDVYVNNGLVLDDITIVSGSGPVSFNFTATAGDQISILVTPGSWPSEMSYVIYDPLNNHIATDGPGCHGFGFIPEEIADIPLWNAPVATFELPATLTYLEYWAPFNIYKFNVILPAPVTLDDGWVSVQNLAPPGTDMWFFWNWGSGGDGMSYLRYPSGKGAGHPLGIKSAAPTQDPRAEVVRPDMGFELYTGSFVQGYTLQVNAYDRDWYVGNGYSYPSIVPPFNDPNDVNAEILLNGVPYNPPIYTPYLFGGPNSQPFVAGAYSVQDILYSFWLPLDFAFQAVNLDYSIDFLGYNEPPLPVELSSFTALDSGHNGVQLAWVSQSETNLLGYRVYRNGSSDLASATTLTPSLVPATNTSEPQAYLWTDAEVEADQTYFYWLESVDAASSDFHGPVSVTVEGNVPPVLPETSSLQSAHPNPFQSGASTSIDVVIKGGESGTVTLYNILGQAVRIYTLTEGSHTIAWDGLDGNGQACGSGIYFYRLSTPTLNQTRKLVILK